MSWQTQVRPASASEGSSGEQWVCTIELTWPGCPLDDGQMRHWLDRHRAHFTIAFAPRHWRSDAPQDRRNWCVRLERARTAEASDQAAGLDAAKARYWSMRTTNAVDELLELVAMRLKAWQSWEPRKPKPPNAQQSPPKWTAAASGFDINDLQDFIRAYRDAYGKPPNHRGS